MNIERPHRVLAILAGVAFLGIATTSLSATKSTHATATPKVVSPHYPNARATVSFSLYQDLLNQHLWTTSAPGKPLETRFNYELYFDEKGRGERSFHIRQQFLDARPASLDRANRTAWAINFYNYLVIERITDYLLIPSKKRQRYTSVREIRPMGQDFFKTPIVKVDTTEYSLDDFEKHFLFDDFDRKPGSVAPESVDPRIHFALVCGAIGCPPLQPRAYRADSLDRQLDTAVRQSLASPVHFEHRPGTPSVRLSAIFFWYAPDFGGLSKAVPWCRPYLEPAEQAELAKSAASPQISQIIWDWRLNQVVGWRFQYQMDKPIPGAAARDTT